MTSSLSGYASDITRTFPVSGKFTSAQSALYAAVLSVQKSLIPLCTQSSQSTLNDLHRKSCQLLKQELKQIGFSASLASDLETTLYPHFLSHPIGIGEFLPIISVQF
jgi:intermediate cleaving peptidase 55